VAIGPHNRSWYLVSQLLSSATNLLLTIWVATSASVEDFGSFATVSAVYLVGIGYLRAVVFTPLLAEASEPHVRGEFRRLALSISLPVAILVGVGSQFLPGSISGGMLALAASLPLVAHLDALRFAAFDSGSPRVAAMLDLRWLASTGALLTIARFYGANSFETGLLLWALAACLSSGRWSRSEPAGRRLLDLMRRSAGARGGLAAEHTLRTGALQGALFVLGLNGLLDEAAGVRGAMTLSAPLMLIANSFTPMWTKQYAGEITSTRAFRPAGLLMAGSCIVGAAVNAAPSGLYRTLLGESASATRSALPAITLVLVFEATAAPLNAALRAKARTWPLIVSRTAYTGVVTCGVVYAIYGAPSAFSCAIAIGELASTATVALAVFYSGERRPLAKSRWAGVRERQVPSLAIGLCDLCIFLGGVRLTWGGSDQEFRSLTAMAAVVFVLCFSSSGMYRRFGQGARASISRTTGVATGTAFLIWLVAIAARTAPSTNREWPLLAGAALVVLWRVAVKRLERLAQGRQIWIVVGFADELSEQAIRARQAVKNHQDIEVARSIYVTSTSLIDQADLIARSHTVLVLEEVPEVHLSKIIELCAQHRVNARIVPSVPYLLSHGGETQRVGDLLIVTLGNLRLSGLQAAVKRIIDIAASVAILAFGAPAFIICALMIRMEDGGPAIYSQVRTGRADVPFRVLKFRSMVVNAEENTGPVLATGDDSRVTKVGKLLRSTRLDELPQVINILKGEMSLVGPRPERPEMIVDLRRTLPRYDLRHSIRPGLTGLAQVTANYSTTPEDKLRFDLIYIQQQTLGLDLRILLQTVRVALARSQATGVAASGSPAAE
jgi:exopolysaccharide biosynthesis polyprenyl glycosylphosphotransferase